MIGLLLSVFGFGATQLAEQELREQQAKYVRSFGFFLLYAIVTGFLYFTLARSRFILALMGILFIFIQIKYARKRA